jgi:hypothetical protein
VTDEKDVKVCDTEPGKNKHDGVVERLNRKRDLAEEAVLGPKEVEHVA